MKWTKFQLAVDWQTLDQDEMDDDGILRTQFRIIRSSPLTWTVVIDTDGLLLARSSVGNWYALYVRSDVFAGWHR